VSREPLEENIDDLPLKRPSMPPPRIFEGVWHHLLPVGFDTVTIQLDGRMQSDLDWKQARLQAQMALDKGYTLMWNMQLGLFQELNHPLHDQTQFLALTLALKHFRDFLAEDWISHTFGISLYRGRADWSDHFSWNSHQEHNLRAWLQENGSADFALLSFEVLKHHPEGRRLIELFCRDVAVEYLTLLSGHLPEDLPVYVFLDATASVSDLVHHIQLLHPERFDRLRLAVKGSFLPLDHLGWQIPTQHGYSGYFPVQLPPVEEVTIGICLPSKNLYHPPYYAGLDRVIQWLQEKRLRFKIMTESHLTLQWNGLNELFYLSTGLSAQGKRKLQGFCAAGGTAVAIQELVGLPHEMAWDDWILTRSL
jgi:hypothetical protein